MAIELVNHNAAEFNRRLRVLTEAAEAVAAMCNDISDDLDEDPKANEIAEEIYEAIEPATGAYGWDGEFA